MKQAIGVSVICSLALCCIPLTALAQDARLIATPAVATPGSIVRLTLDRGVTSSDVVSIEGEMSGERLHFARSGTTWRAIGAVPVDATTPVTARVRIELSSGEVDSATAEVRLPKSPPSARRAPRRTLSVDSRFTRPMDSATQARVARENQRAREVGRASHSTPRLWTSPFIRPRTSAVTSRFGTGRTFNGTLSSRHLGVDFRGGVGAPVHAANRGVVALVDDFFLAGNVVYIDHGAGVVTSYFHLSQTLVSAGDTVSRGQEIGMIGATGRVTGPHLHWSARYGALTVNPLDLVALGAGW